MSFCTVVLWVGVLAITQFTPVLLERVGGAYHLLDLHAQCHCLALVCVEEKFQKPNNVRWRRLNKAGNSSILNSRSVSNVFIYYKVARGFTSIL